MGISVKTKLNKTTQILFSQKLDKTIVYQYIYEISILCLQPLKW